MSDAFRSRLELTLADIYTFESELGGGGMSRTYLAHERSLDRRVVVKVLAPELLEGLSVERFKREVLMAAKLQHPHVVPVLASGDADGLPWFAMPYVDGESLRQRMLRGPIPLDEALGILRDVARALAYAHSHGIVHRDIKPDNVLLSGSSATVTDFGIAKAIDASRATASNATLTQAGMAIGTPAYMAPEQAAADPDLDHRADLYAFGAMAYELLSGEQLFAGRTPARVLAAHLGEAPRDVRELQPALPPELGALVMQCLAKEPAARPPDAHAIVRALDGVYTSGGASSAMPVAAPRIRLARALATWAATAVVVLGVVWAATEYVGLPTWALSGAAGIVFAGLPAVLGTWWIQRTARRATSGTPTRTPGGTRMPAGTMATMAIRASSHVSWTRTWRAGAMAIGALLLLVTGFVTTRALGIGPAASLIGKGAFGEKETVVVADFRPPQSDSLLGITVAEALRTDLAQSANLTVLTRAVVRDILDRMQRPRESVVPFELAREIATREGARAVVDGEIVKLGTRYVISARLVSSLDGKELATFRETAENDEALVPAVGVLSRSIRERVGESFKGIRRTHPLERVTTASLPALRKYVEANEIIRSSGDDARALRLLEEAVAIDSTFAMAWRRISVLLSNAGTDVTRSHDALSRAMRFRDRLSDEERAITEGSYYSRGPEPDVVRAASAYEELLRRDSMNSTALNNLSVIYSQLRRYKEAAALLRRAVQAQGAIGSNFTNLQGVLLALKDTLAIDSVALEFERRLPNHSDLWAARSVAAFARGLWDSSVVEARNIARSPRNPRQAGISNALMAEWAARRGRPNESLTYLKTLREAQATDATMMVTVDSAYVVSLYDGDLPAARVLLHRALLPEVLARTPVNERGWINLLVAASLAEDTASARIGYDGYQREEAPRNGMRRYSDALAQALVLIAEQKFDESIDALRRAIAERESPDDYESFTMAISHERAGRPDSAIVWFETSLTTPKEGFTDGLYEPFARRKLGELLEAKGDLRGALKYYEAFLRDWTQPEPAQAAVVRDVQARVARIRARLG